MSEPQGAAGESSPRRRIMWWGSRTTLEFYSWLDGKRAFRPTIVVLVATAVGLLCTPDLLQHDYPGDAALEGTPASENIKAPYDLDVVDEETTNKLRDEAVARIRRVYDFDALLGEKSSERIARAFDFMRHELESAQGTRVKLDEAALARRAPFEKLLNITLKTDEFIAFRAAHFGSELEDALKRLVMNAQAEPLVGNIGSLEADKGRGVTVQRVPAEEKPHDVVEGVEAISDLEGARQEMSGRASRLLPQMAAGLRSHVVAVATRMVEPNMSLNRAETERQRAEARASVKPVSIAVKKGEMVARDGERLSHRHLLIFDALRGNGRGSSFTMVALGAAALFLALITTAARFAKGYGRRRVHLRARDLTFLAVLFVGGLGSARLWLLVSRALHDNYPGIPLEAFRFVLPVAAGTMMVRLVLRAEVALLFSLIGSFMLGLLADSDHMLGLYALVGAVAATSAIRTISARSDLLKAGMWVGLAQVCTALGIHLFGANVQWQSYLFALPAAFCGGVLSGFVALSLTPLVEWAFTYTTDLKLLELSNLNHPALKELIVQAPGSYHHSIIVGALVEAAAESIGANPLLARVMAYYHDLGKGCNPGYFIENQRTGQNPHDKLKPSMSAMIIRRHVTDGIELAKQHALGEQILAGIAEHHGTTLIHYFFHKAKELADNTENISEAEYRYPGRKPQTREAALVMVGDSIEAAARSLADPTPARLQGLVTRIISHKFTDGQLEECDLTLRDLHTIAKSFSRVLNSIYHHRLEYPDILKDISGKKQNGDSDSKPQKRAEGGDGQTPSDSPDNLRRLGL